MAEPPGKRLKSGLPLCRAHRSSAGRRAALRLPAAVEDALCGVSSLLRDGAYRLQGLASAFERDDVALPRVASFFHQEALKQEEEAEAMLGYLAERGGNFCSKDIQMADGIGGGVGVSQRGLRPPARVYESCKIVSGPSQQHFGTPQAGLRGGLRRVAGLRAAAAPAEGGGWRPGRAESAGSQPRRPARGANVVKSHFLSPRVDRLKLLLGDLLTNARRVGCTADRAGGLGEYILNELQDELSR
ncbi:hypothetical protein L3Q82_023580 [Scortum barcoo]|uniref:Uncharacterized protein n=1 Tax=Scortum barcoo TaxID=214431 RepID=A0ACB8WUX3_9TELE|nr:hypothetical protein L3Q82_023580 [Scortum barcoo]